MCFRYKILKRRHVLLSDRLLLKKDLCIAVQFLKDIDVKYSMELPCRQWTR